jgi:hypothetical protein
MKLHPRIKGRQGEFDWHKGNRDLSVELRYRRADLAGCLAPLLQSRNYGGIRIEIGLLPAPSESEADRIIHGETSFWSVNVFQTLVQDQPKDWLAELKNSFVLPLLGLLLLAYCVGWVFRGL